MSTELRKFPRTSHVRGSRFQNGDGDLEAVPWVLLADKHIVIEEKIDGANCGISFTEDGVLMLQSRGHYLRGGPREKHFNMLKQWASCHQEAFFEVIGSRYIIYGEYMYAKHTVYYDALPHYFMEFDILDTTTDAFLSTPERKRLLFEGSVRLPIEQVLVLGEGKFEKLSDVRAFIKRSNFITDDRIMNLNNAAEAAGVVATEAWKHTDPSTDMEGLYIKWEENGTVKGRYKFVRSSFTNSILDQDTHWHDRPIIPNRLVPGAYEKMFV